MWYLFFQVPGTPIGTKMPIKDLKEGEKYKFRVRAKNVEGLSEPLETTRPVLAKNPFGKYCFFENVYDLLLENAFLWFKIILIDSIGNEIKNSKN